MFFICPPRAIFSFSRFRRNVPIQVPMIGPDRQVALKYMSIRGQEIWAGLHRQTEETPSPEDRLGGIFADADAVARRQVR